MVELATLGRPSDVDRSVFRSVESDQAAGYTSVRIGVRLIPRRSCGCEFDVMRSLESEELAQA